MYTLATASKLMKIVYGPYLGNQVDTATSPLYQKIEKTSRYNVGGQKFVMATPIGVDGGTGAIGETDALPTAGAQSFENFETVAKLLAGVFRITHVAWKSAQTSEQAFRNLLRTRSEALDMSLKRDMARQFWGNGSGVMSTLVALGVAGGTFTVSTGIQNLVQGQVVDIYDYSGASYAVAKKCDKVKIANVANKPNGTLAITVKTLAGAAVSVTLVAKDTGELPYVVMQGVTSGKEITGLAALHDASITSLFGVTKAGNDWLVPYALDAVNAISDKKIQDALAYAKDYAGSNPDFLIAGSAAYSSYGAYLEATKRNVNRQTLVGGYDAIGFGDKMLIADRFAPAGDFQFMETAKWHMCQIGDWEWMAGDTADENILKQVPGFPYYQATILKLAELMCDHPGGQIRLLNCNAA